MEFMNHWTWLIVAIAFGVLEMFAPGIAFLWLGLSALVVTIVLVISPDLSVEWQLILFAVFGVVFALLGRYWVKKHPIQSESPLLNRRAEQYVGRKVTLVEPIVNGSGYVQLDDTRWLVEGDDLAAGTKVEIVGVNHASLVVKTCR